MADDFFYLIFLPLAEAVFFLRAACGAHHAPPPKLVARSVEAAGHRRWLSVSFRCAPRKHR